ncbi:T9SS type A sorting domain-containing protein [Spongiimicrobium sp. 3-5]|uniref:T9SS type A sorting domain-containing protein n=1 Tax=Spongiimicrobium sp. 3-5 TaxID=3332596 RepID=UPI0039806EBF
MRKGFFCILLTSALSFSGFSQSPITSDIKNGKEVSVKPNIKVFPNPATNVVHVLGLEDAPKAQITIMNMSGNSVMELRWEIRDNSLSIPIANLGPGIYTITIISKEQRIRKRFYKR